MEVTGFVGFKCEGLKLERCKGSTGSLREITSQIEYITATYPILRCGKCAYPMNS